MPNVPAQRDRRVGRGIVVSRNGAVAASQPLAVSAGLRMLQMGGAFADAAVATSAVLVVTEPYNSHLGGDAFAVLYDSASGDTLALNGSGAAPTDATLDRFAGGIPPRGVSASAVPGLVDVWRELHGRYGRLLLSTVLAPAIAYARDGFPAGYRYASVLGLLQEGMGSWAPPLLRTLTGASEPPRPGTLIVQPELARTLTTISERGPREFYEGSIADRIVDGADGAGGWFTRTDLATHHTEVRAPIRTCYRGYTVHGQPPVSQAVILIESLNILGGFPLGEWDPLGADAAHHMVEAKKLAAADRLAYLGDPRHVPVPVETLISAGYAERRRARLDPMAAARAACAGDPHRDTTYFCVADSDGCAVSFIQSIFHGFGCGWVAPGTGILFNNRMTGFATDPSSPNCVQPGKRPIHTLNAYVVTGPSGLAWVGGTPGGHVQVQSNLQVISRLVDHGMTVQEAIEAPRWQHVADPDLAGLGVLELEDRFPEHTVAELRRRGHNVRVIDAWGHGSSYQLIARDGTTGSYHAGSDPRCDGHAAGW